MSSLMQFAASFADAADSVTRSGNIYQVYERYFQPLRDKPVRLLELGVHRGASLKTWGAYFRMEQSSASTLWTPARTSQRIQM